MSVENTVEYNSLSWVKAQLDDVVSDAQANLNEYIENKTEENLENCIEHLQLIYGTLQMVELYGAAMLAEEMRLTTAALLEGKVDRAEDAYDVLMRAMLHLPDYLEGIQAGKKDAPITLMPLINDLRTARKEGLLTESALFSPDIENTELPSDGYDAATIEAGKLQAEVKRLRTHYQLGLLDYIRNNKERVGLQRIKAVLNSLEKASSNDEVRRVWMVAGALVEGLMKRGIDTNLSIKMLLGAIDRQLKLVLDEGEEAFAGNYSKELLKNILYYVGLSSVESKGITAVKQAYQLDDLIHQETEDAGAMIGGLNADLFETVSKGITEDLIQVKDVLELFMQSNDKSMEQLEPIPEQLGRIADTYGMLGMGDVRQSIMDQRDVMQSIVGGETEISEPVVSTVAYELLNAESELKDYIASRSGFVDMNRDHEDHAVPAAEYRQVVFTVVSQGLKNFSEAKEAVLSYVSGIGDKEQLEIILNRLEEVRGVSMMLPLGRVESLIEKLQRYIRVALLNNDHKPDLKEQDTVADVVTSIEYFFEALSEGRPGVEQGLNAGEEAASTLESITESYDDSTVETAKAESEVEVEDESEAPGAVAEEIIDEPVAAKVAVEEPEKELLETEQVEAETGEAKQEDRAESVASEPAEVTPDISEYAILADDADEEIVEIFIEEAVEVLGELHTYLPQWKVNNDDEEALAVVRRSFHTLKGSGRLLGANLIGEFAWKFENMLNRVIENKINVSEPLLHVLDEALAVLPQLIEQLKGNREPIDNIGQLMSSADAIAEGRDVVFASEEPAVAEPVPEVVSEIMPEVVDAAAVEAVDDFVEEVNESPAIDEGEVAEVISDDEVEEIVDFGLPDDEAEGIAEDQVSEDDYSGLLDSMTDSGGEEAAAVDVTEDISALDVEEISVTDLSDEIEAAEEVITLDTGEIAEDEFDIELPSAGAEQEETEAEAEASSVEELIDLSAESEADEELIDLSDDTELSDEFEIEIDEGEAVIAEAEDELDIDPMLLKIYYDESQGHIASVRQLLDESDASGQPLKADKTLIRAFHTLYGSARTAEVDAIADVSGAAEKYVKARQEGGEIDIPGDVISVLREVEQAISSMLLLVERGKLPAHDKALQDKINKVVQKEIQGQLQRSWQDKSSPVDSADLEPADVQPSDEPTMAEAVDDEPVIDDSFMADGGDLSIDMSELAPGAEDLDVADSVSDEVVVSTEQPIAQEAVAEESVQMSYGDIDDELIDIFLEEADELLESCEDTLNEIKNTPNSTEHIHQLQRNMHTLKGGARMAELTPVGDLTHNLESLVVMVDEKKVNADKTLFDLLQESLDVLTSMLGSVKKREALVSANNLNNRIEMLMRGEVEEKRSVERFDVELSELESTDDEELEDIDISHLLPRNEADRPAEAEVVVAEQQQEQPVTDLGRRAEDAEQDKPHWGERATDVNFKDSQEQVRVRSDLLNSLVNYAGEVNIYHARMGKQISDFGFNLSELTQTVVRLKEQLRKLEIETEIQIRSGYEKESDSFDENFDPLEMDQYSTMQQLTRSLGETAGDVESINEILSEITRDSETLLGQESRISTDLQEGLMRTRMVRFGGLSSRLRRIVRQVSRELGKEVEVEIVGDSSEVDRTVLDRIIAPLEHMLRNAVAHGIEMPEERKALGKDETGTILISVDRQGADVVIDVKDDGAGIDVSKVRAKAIKQGFITYDSQLSDHDILQFILQSGISTADEVSQVAGRGVGMDVVDSEIKQLGGVLDIETKPGKGTVFHIRLPLTLAINQALLVSTTEDVFAIPLASIEGVVRITGLELQRFYDSDNSHYEFNGIEYELKHLGGMLTGNQGDYSKQLQLFPVLLVHVGDKHFALHVDDLLGRREIVVKPVGMQIGGVRGIAGATILADGRVVLILEMSALVVADSLFKEHIPVVEEAEPVIVDKKKTIMVVDDSITIRKVTERMLSRYGIDVILAKDGVDATNQLQERMPDLMLLDIEMPRMDGFEVASFVRNDERLKNLPIIMITSRTGSKHKEKAMEIGVNQYLGKPFQEDDLVSNINEILHTAF
jgi:chemosensory pili system protein ChpA (sensor histidine kinase/response regulator)